MRGIGGEPGTVGGVGAVVGVVVIGQGGSPRLLYGEEGGNARFVEGGEIAVPEANL